MRLRRDNWHTAGQRRARDLGALDTSSWDREWAMRLFQVPAALVGDVWRVAVHDDDGRCHGFVLTCPVVSCDQGVHAWHHGSKCPARRSRSNPCALGDRPGMDSCWTWTGSAEAGTLTATPSLHSPLADGGCGFHGFLTNGVLA